MILSFLLFRFVMRRNAKKENTETDVPLPNPEEWRLTSEDGLSLYARYYACSGTVGAPQRTLLCVHGFRSSGVHNFGALLPFLRQSGCNILLPDLRTHGESQGRYYTFGAQESRDLALWAARLAERTAPLPLYLFGVSMGGTSVLAALRYPLPECFSGVIADCAFTSPREIFRHVLQQKLHLPFPPLLPFTGLYCRLFAGYRIRDFHTCAILAQEKRPVLLIHGRNDRLVPTEMSIRNFTCCASAQKQLFLAEGAGHAESFRIEPNGYRAALTAFWKQCES